MPRFVVSACLAGVPCRYDGTAGPCPEVLDLMARGEALPVCPEILGGLPTPRIPCERTSRGVTARDGSDRTAAYEDGAAKAAAIARDAGCTEAILKARSPACGHGRIYDGTFTHSLIDGNGVFAERLAKLGFTIHTEESLLLSGLHKNNS